MTFLTSPGKTYSIYSVAGCTVSADGSVVVTVDPGKQIAFVAPGEEISVSDPDAIVVEVTGIGADLTVAGDLPAANDNLREAQIYIPVTVPSALVSGCVYDLGVLSSDQDLSAVAFKAEPGYVQTCEIWMETGDTGYSVTWPEGSVWPDEVGGISPDLVLPTNKRYRFAVRAEGDGTIVINKAYEYSV